MGKLGDRDGKHADLSNTCVCAAHACTVQCIGKLHFLGLVTVLSAQGRRAIKQHIVHKNLHLR